MIFVNYLYPVHHDRPSIQISGTGRRLRSGESPDLLASHDAKLTQVNAGIGLQPVFGVTWQKF